MPALGSFVLLATFVVASYALAACVAGGRRRSRALIESGVGAFYMTAALMTVASGILVHAFVTGNYAIKYVQRYSDSAMPLAYKITSYWGGLDGSIMFWVFLLSIFGTIAVSTNRERHRELIPWVVAIISATEMFFIFIMVVHNNPFDTFVAGGPADGKGLSPLLQNFYMAIHPPSLYTGFVAMTIPYAFGMAALITGHLDDAWLRAVRRWTMIGWLFLTFGLTLGMLWAYEELGWGGFWGWDPVENAGLLPWFTATAFLHSVMVQERRGMLRVWNVTLVITTFFLTIFGTFMTRSGVVASVHAFGEDRWLASLFTTFMILIVTFSFGWVIYRLPLLKSRHELDSWASREAAFLANNWILLFSAFFILFATMFPTLSEAVRGQRLTVGPPFFNTWMRPIGLALLVLTGIAPLLAWRKSTLSNLVHQFTWPVAATMVTGAAVYALGIKVWSSGICFALCAFVGATILQEFIRGAQVRQGASGADILTALIGLVSRQRRRYGGYIVHVGITLMFLGFAGQGYKLEENMKLNPGQTGSVGGFTIRHDSISVTSDEQKQMITGHVTVTRGGKMIAEMTPARWFFAKHEDQPTTEVAIRRAPGEDVYIVLAAYEMETQNATYAVTINPLVNWIWFGFGILAFGTGIALLPERALALAGVKVPEGAATTTLLILMLLLPMTARAQTVIPRDQLRKQLEGDIMCTCGGCKAPMNNCPMGGTCHGLKEQREKLEKYLDAGMNREQIRAAFVKDHGGQDVLAAPIDEGFNKLAWALPYVAGATGAALVGLVAFRWTRKREDAADGSALTNTTTPREDARDASLKDAALKAQLDDELRDLD
ncbi:MAG TPA: cytochrome c-type biogenesis CcmF C-terminal domain-containing protein [Vicinamibacterales bacterium]|nr:cytochrome c-type biogenesis CcmF C-terminal domain-containing protein [Vicinamibacterales bacterium]